MQLDVSIILRYFLNGFCNFLVGAFVVYKLPDDWSGNPITGRPTFFSDILLVLFSIILMLIVNYLFMRKIVSQLEMVKPAKNWLALLNVIGFVLIFLVVLNVILGLGNLFVSILTIGIVILAIGLFFLDLYQLLKTKNLNWYNYGSYFQMMLVLIFWLSFWVNPL